MKFKSLWMSGYDASLCIKANLGYVNVNVNCKVGRPVPPPFASKCMSSAYQKSRSPSYFRRQERRRATHDLSNASLSDSDDALANDQVGKADIQQENVGPIESDPIKDTEIFAEAEKDVVEEMLGTADGIYSTEEIDQAELDRDRWLKS